ncbi:MAG: exopolyphosphatase [Pseudomonadota bacterium]|nr:MAG: exopolyphosphatase [Pseudomonadota bacterium]
MIAASRARRARRKLPDMVAAVDLGSNSFHMIVARVVDGQLHVLDRIQEMVRLAAGLDDKNRLTKTAQIKALACLERFGQRLHGMAADSVRVVGTNALRRARNGAKFLLRAERALGYPIEVISGREEARLIYLGVARDVADDKPRLVIDIGGGSTELILGEGLKANAMESLYMGCVSLSEAHFRNGKITKRAMHAAETAAHLELEPVAAQFKTGWQSVIGTSGTIRTAAAVVKAAGWSDAGITATSLVELRRALLDAGLVQKLKLAGLSDDRAPVFAGGVAVLTAVFDAIGIKHMRVADSALREGLLYDLHGRIRYEDAREQTIAALISRYHVDDAQGERVAQTARECFEQVARDWKLGEDDAAALDWAAYLHEIGLAVAHTQYHKHGAYLVRHADLAGFSRTEQALLAALIRAHRRKFPLKEFKLLPKPVAKRAQRLALLLRLAVLLHRAHNGAVLPRLKLQVESRALALRFPPAWLDQHPLTEADLAQEAEYLRAARFRLSVT